MLDAWGCLLACLLACWLACLLHFLGTLGEGGRYLVSPVQRDTRSREGGSVLGPCREGGRMRLEDGAA